MKNIEIEVRSFISQKAYKRLRKKLDKEAKFLKSVNEETIYFRAERENKVLANRGSYFKGIEGDLRLRRDRDQAFVIFKKGKIHDNSREEIEIKFDRKDFEKIKKLFVNLGSREVVKWFRKRRVYQWKGTKVFLDDTKGYGFIIELEKIGKVGEGRKIHQQLENKLKSLGVKITPKEVFEKKFEYYKKNWQKILGK